jgi:lipoprotein-anchoring transpeptidase ErfK/SrfK
MMPTTPMPSTLPTLLRRAALMLGLATVAGLMLLISAGAQPARSAVQPQVPAEQPLVTLLSVKSVHKQPIFGSRSLVGLADQRPLTLVRTSLPIIDHMTDAEGRAWLQVRMPGRVFHRKTPPRTGWITAFDTRLSTTAWRLVLTRSTRKLHVYRGGRKVKTFTVLVGKASTPTPRGEFFIEETMRLPRKHVGYPFALATSARSAVFREFMGGPGQIAFHGIVNIPGSKMGTASSNGCIRMTTAALTWLGQRIQAGVPLTIR